MAVASKKKAVNATAALALFLEDSREELAALKSKLVSERGENAELEAFYLPAIDKCVVIATPDTDTVIRFMRELRDDDKSYAAHLHLAMEAVVYPNAQQLAKYIEEKDMTLLRLADGRTYAAVTTEDTWRFRPLWTEALPLIVEKPCGAEELKDRLLQYVVLVRGPILKQGRRHE